MQVKGPTEVKGRTKMNFKEGADEIFFARSARELISCSPTFKIMAPLLNVVH